MEKPKITIITPKLSKNRKDSFWYKGDGQIATIELNGRILSVEPRGEIRVQFKEDGDMFRDEQAVTEAIKRGYGDKRLAKIHDFDGFANNNWFVIIELDKDGNDVSDDLEIGYDYDEMIELAKEMILDLE